MIPPIKTNQQFFLTGYLNFPVTILAYFILNYILDEVEYSIV